MTRETKIGLLVGLAFIIVIGILLSDQRRGAMDPVPAQLSAAGPNARVATNTPGQTPPPPINFVSGDPLPQHGHIAAHDEMQRPALPVDVTPQHNDRTAQTPPRGGDATARGEDHGADLEQHDPLNGLVQRHPQDLVSVGPIGQVPSGPTPTPPTPAPAPTVARNYKAQSGDTVSRLAGRFLGANNQKNRQAIIDANPSLQDDPNNVVIGKTYVIPGAITAATPAPAPTTDAPTAAAPTTGAPVASGDYYVVEEGDTLWGIATDEVGDANAVAAIKELNKNILHGDVLRPGMKLRLPGKTVASAN